MMKRKSCLKTLVVTQEVAPGCLQNTENAGELNHSACSLQHSPIHCFLLSVSLFEDSSLIELISINFVEFKPQCLISANSDNVL